MYQKSTLKDVRQKGHSLVEAVCLSPLQFRGSEKNDKLACRKRPAAAHDH